MKYAKFVVMPIEELSPADYNPRKMSVEARAGLEASVAALGLLQPIVFNERTKRIVGGHQRLQALIGLGFERAPVALVDLSEKDEKELNILLNSERARGRMQSQKIQDLLLEIQDDPLFVTTRLDILLDEFKIDTLQDSFKPEEKRQESVHAEAGDKAEDGDDGMKFLRLHFTQLDAVYVERQINAYMKENDVPSMTEAIMVLLSQAT